MYYEKDLPSLPRPERQTGGHRSPPIPRPLVTEDFEVETLQKENENLRRQIAFMQNELNLEKDRLVTSLRRQNRQHLRKISQLNEFIAGIAKTMRTVFADYDKNTAAPLAESGKVPATTVSLESSEEIKVYSAFDSDGD